MGYIIVGILLSIIFDQETVFAFVILEILYLCNFSLLAAQMAGNTSEESKMLNFHHHSQCGEGSTEWRPCELDEEAGPLFSPAYWDIDDDDDFGVKTSDLYEKFTWKIENFSQINKKDLRSRVFQIGGYEWYILIYPHGCDVHNHLSLFLCVANHDKLLPGWSHFAQFTISVINKETKKSKFSDTLHRFWKKEHDWGWKKFVELSKVLDLFINDDTLHITAQVQVIRERVDKPFRCLDARYRRTLLHSYMSNVEQIFSRFVEERRIKLVKLKEDKMKWSSFCSFWMEINNSSKRIMSREKSDTILRMVVKQFFVEKEVTSTLVMDSLHSGLKFIEDHAEALMYPEELPMPLVRVHDNTFVLVEDILVLLEKASMESLPPNGDIGHLNRTKDGDIPEGLNHDAFYYEEMRLTEIGRRTIEIFALSHILSKIEVAYCEAVSLKRQEELIREEEAAYLAEAEQRARRGASEKEKKSKKKQGKQKRNNRKGKDKGKVENPDKVEKESELGVGEISDASDSIDCVSEILPPDSGDRDCSSVYSEVHPFAEANKSETISSIQSPPNGKMERTTIQSLGDDNSVTCSKDPTTPLLNDHVGYVRVKQKKLRSPNRRNKQVESSINTPPGLTGPELTNNPSGSYNEAEPEPEAEPESVPHGLPEEMMANKKTDKEEEEIADGKLNLRIDKDEIQRFSEPKAAKEMKSSENSFPEDMPFARLLLNPGIYENLPTSAPSPAHHYSPQPYRNSTVGSSVPSSSFTPQMSSNDFASPSLMQNNDHLWTDPPKVDNANKSEQDDTLACSSGRTTTESFSTEEFPHLDIINALFEDDNGSEDDFHDHHMNQEDDNESEKRDDFHYHHMNQELNISRQPRVYYGDGLGRYGSFGRGYIHYPIGMGPFGYLNWPGYMSGHIEGVVVPNQWAVGGSYNPYFRTMNYDGFHYRVLDYSNLAACSHDGYGSTLFHPSNEH